jgi:hypothetical protein
MTASVPAAPLLPASAAPAVLDPVDPRVPVVDPTALLVGPAVPVTEATEPRPALVAARTVEVATEETVPAVDPAAAPVIEPTEPPPVLVTPAETTAPVVEPTVEETEPAAEPTAVENVLPTEPETVLTAEPPAVLETVVPTWVAAPPIVLVTAAVLPTAATACELAVLTLLVATCATAPVALDVTPLTADTTDDVTAVADRVDEPPLDATAEVVLVASPAADCTAAVTVDVAVDTACGAGFWVLLDAGDTGSGVPAETWTDGPADPTVACTPPTETDTTPDPRAGAPALGAAGSVCCAPAAACCTAGFCAAGGWATACCEGDDDGAVGRARAGAVAAWTAPLIVSPRPCRPDPEALVPVPMTLEPPWSSLCAADADCASRKRVAPAQAAPASAATANVRPRADLTLTAGCTVDPCSHVIVRRR